MDGTKSERHRADGRDRLKRIDQGQSEVGYWVAPAFWNTGLASARRGAVGPIRMLPDLFRQRISG